MLLRPWFSGSLRYCNPAVGHRESRRITAPQTEIVAVPSGVVIKVRAAEAAKSWTHMKHPPTATASGAVARPMPVEPDGPEAWPRPMQHSNPPPASNKSITINDLMAAAPRKAGDWNNPGHLSTRELPGPAGRNAAGKDQVRGLRLRMYNGHLL